MTSIAYQPTPEEQATREASERWRALGSPGYRPESQKYTWEQLNALPEARRKDARGNIGGDFGGTAVYQDWQQRENRNRDSERAAFNQWRKQQGAQNQMTTPASPRPAAPMQPQGMTPSKPGPGRPSTPMQPQMTPSKPGPGRPSVPMGTYSAGQAQPQYSPYATATPYNQAKTPVQLADPHAAQAAVNQSRPQQAQTFNRYGPGTSPEYMARNPDTSGFNPTANRPPPMYGIYAPGSTAEDISRARPDALPGPSHPAADRPPPFQATTQNFDGTQSQMPNFQQRDAFIAQINNQLGQMQQQSWQRPGMGAPQFNFPQMWGQAGQMAQQGFRNPFAIPAGQQGALAPLSQPGGPAGAGRLHSGFPQMAGDIVPGAVGQPMSPQMLDLLRQRPGVVF